MPKFYFTVNRREFFNAPQFTRVNHRFRGQRESEKINLEVHQMYFSIRKLYNLTASLRERYLNYATLLVEGGTIANDLTDQSGTPLFLEGINSLTTRASMLERRLKSLPKP